MSEVIGEDRISDLPDALLHRILSFVHTKFAVRTSVLSKRWKKLWSFLPNLDLYCHDFRSFDSFMFFVNRVLLLRHPSDIKEFRLTCWQHKDEYVSHVDGWIRAAIMRNPVVLDLKLVSFFRGGVPLPMLPLSLFMCETLVVLKLWSHFIPSTSTAWCLPNLKVLLVTVHYPDNDPIENVLSRCPAVEDLTINGVVGEHVVLNFKVYALQLKTLTIRLTTREGDHHARHNELTLSIRAPKLESFDLQQSVLSNIILGNAASLVKATIDLYEPCFHRSELPAFIYRAAALFKQIGNVKYLSLSAHCLEARHLPAFGNLNYMKLDIHHCCYWWKQFLKGIPNLKSLVLVLGMHCNCHKVHGRFNNTLPERNLLDSVPSCLSSSLKTICIKGFLGHQDDLDIAKYLLENGQVLNCMKIHTKQTHLCSKEEIYKKLFTCGSASKSCLVEIIEGYSQSVCV